MARTRQVKNGICVVIPTYNEENGIGRVIDGVRVALTDYPYSIVIVDGYSNDRTVDIAEEKGAKVIFQNGRGYGDALQTGFEYSYRKLRSSITVMLDADGTYDPQDIAKLVEPIINHTADLVVGNRFEGLRDDSMTFVNRIGNKFLSWLVRRALKIEIIDTQSGIRAFRTTLLRKMDFRATGMPFATEMLIEAKEAKARILQVPVSYGRRVGETKLKPIQDGLRILGTTLRLVRDYRPLLLFGLLGFSFGLAGFFLGLDVVGEWIATGTIKRLPSVILSSLLLTTGFSLFSLGLVADMIRDMKRRLR